MTIAGKVFAESSTQTVGTVAIENGGKQIDIGYVFPDRSVLRIDPNGIGYCASDVAEYEAAR